MKTANDVLDAVKVALEATVPNLLVAYRGAHPMEDVPNIREVYLEEYDYEQAFNTPAFLVFEADPIVEIESSGSYFFTLPLDIVAWDTADASGMAQLHRRLKTYRAVAIEAMVKYHNSSPGLWHGVSIAVYGSGPPTPMSTGAVGRALGVQLHFNVEETY